MREPSAQRRGPRFDSDMIAKATGGRVLRAGPPGPVNANHLTMEPGEWFIALRGEGFDDHPFLPEAEQRGAAGVILERDAAGLTGPAVQVAHAWTAIGDLARSARRAFPGPVVAVTGSTGKTTTCVLTRHALAPLGPCHPDPSHQNAQPGLSLALLACPPDAASQVLELGARRPGGLAEYCHVVQPDVRVVVSVGPAHLEFLGDLDGVAREKARLVETARAGDTVVVNLGDPRVAAMRAPAGVRRLTFGRGGMVELLDAVPEQGGLRAVWRTPDGERCGFVPTPARFVAENASAAIAIAWACDVDLGRAVAGLRSYRPLGPRLREVRLPGGVVLLDDCFNANPHSMAGALRVLATRPGRRLAVLGDMGELGPAAPAYHAEVVALAGELGIGPLVLVGPLMAAVAGPSAIVVPDAEAARRALVALMVAGDVVLIKGSGSAALSGIAPALAAEEPDPAGLSRTAPDPTR